MKRFNGLACCFYLVLMLLVCNHGSAQPVSVIVTGTLQASTFYTEVYEPINYLDGATIKVSYDMESTDAPASTDMYDGYTAMIFDNCGISFAITNRPNGQPDIFNGSTHYNMIALNYYSPDLSNDNFVLSDSTTVPVGYKPFYVSGWGFDFGSQAFFPGTGGVPDLSFLSGIDSSTALTRVPNFSNAFEFSECYSITNFNLQIIPEPASALLMLLGAAWVGAKRKR